MQKINTSAIENRLQLLESYIPNSETLNTKKSKANVAWHIDHSLKIINAVVKNMATSDSNLYRNNFSLLGKFFLKIGYFPRGKAKVPKQLTSPKIILKEDIITQLKEAKQHIKKIESLHKNAYFKHPLFGHVNTSRVVRFLDTHTNHHLKIIKSILK